MKCFRLSIARHFLSCDFVYLLLSIHVVFYCSLRLAPRCLASPLVYFNIYGWYGIVHGIYLLWTFMDCPWQHLTTLVRRVPEVSIHPAVRLSLAACPATQSSDLYHGSESMLPCVLPMHSTCQWIVFALTLSRQPCTLLAVAFHAHSHDLLMP